MPNETPAPAAHPAQPYHTPAPKQESFPLQSLARRDTASTTATASSTSSSTWTASSSHRAASALSKLRPSRPRSRHQDNPASSRQRRELDDRAPKQIHQQNLYTDCGRHSNEWLFSGWGDLAKWALSSGGAKKEMEARRGLEDVREDEKEEEEERRGRSIRRED